MDVDAEALAARADALASQSGGAALAERAGVLALLGRLDEAEDCARRSAAGAEHAGDIPGEIRARVVLADVLAGGERFEEAENELAGALAEAAQLQDEALRAHVLEHRGASRFHQGRIEEAERDFTAALAVHRRLGASAEDVAALEQAVAAAMRRIVGDAKR